MQNKKKGIKKGNKSKNVSHHNKKKSQNINKFSKNCKFFLLNLEPAERLGPSNEQ
jgi:hypothetical protein